jgi:Ca-activated chloride channel family protein
MSAGFLWPAFLWGLLLIPALVLAYHTLIRRAAARTVAFPDLGLVTAAAAVAAGWRRHLAAGIFTLGLLLALVAVSRPTFPMPVPADRSAIMLVIDVSGSMRSTDVEPNRLEAAKTAAKEFLAHVPDRVPVGLVTFGGYATLVAPPGTDHAVIRERIDALTFIRRTAIGEGLLEAVAALPGRVRPNVDGTLPPAPPGERPPGIVILLSDGRSNTGISSVRAAEIARQQDVIVHTVGVGARVTPPGAFVIGGPLDESELQAVARTGGGTYHHASSVDALKTVYRRLARSVGWERRPDEVSALFALASAVALVAAVGVARLVSYPLDL